MYRIDVYPFPGVQFEKFLQNKFILLSCFIYSKGRVCLLVLLKPLLLLLGLFFIILSILLVYYVHYLEKLKLCVAYNDYIVSILCKMTKDLPVLLEVNFELEWF